MNIIDSAEALRIIKDVGITYVIEADLLNYLIKESDVSCLKNDDMLVTVSQKNGTKFLNVIPSLSVLFDVFINRE